MDQDQQTETRTRIFDSAAKLFAKRGYASVSMREIADAAEISKPMLYYYFESKAGLCRALIEDGIDKMNAAVIDIVRKSTSVEERLRELTRDRYQAVRKHPEIMRFHTYFLSGPNSSGLAQEFADRMESPLRAISELIAEGQAKNEFTSDVDHNTLTLMYIGLSSMFVYLQIGIEGLNVCIDNTIDDQLADAIVDQFLYGVKVRSN